MIAKLHGVLESLHRDTALVAVDGGLTYQVLLPAFTTSRLTSSLGRSVTFHTHYYLEGQGQGSSMIPRLLGFLSPRDRDFFELLTTCNGIGPRKALRAMAVDPGRIAAAIAERDTATLQSLPEIGRRTAETIIATLHGKVDAFADQGLHPAIATPPEPTTGKKKKKISADPSSSLPAETPSLQNSPEPATLESPNASLAGTNAPLPGAGAGRMVREAVEVLVQLGENRLTAMTWVDQALSEGQRPANTQDLVARVYQLKGAK
ncbi:MAG: hypothetical protein IT443_05180 [Phycisphaeraceae bacterium]|nr:hypothetical protein [Phycisphaeraceae bacterium]